MVTGISALALAFAGSVVVASPAAAAALTASNEAELISAINTANGNGVPDTITLSAGFNLTAALPDITDDLEIIGAGHSIAGDGYRAFLLQGGMTNINVTFTGVDVSDAIYGIDARRANVTITDSSFDDAPVEITGSALTVTVTNSSFDNAFDDDGLYVDAVDSTVVTVSDSTASGNNTDGFDFNLGAGSTATLTDCTADDNDDTGTELRAVGSSTVTVTNSSADNNYEHGFDLDSDQFSSITVTSGSATNNGSHGFDTDAMVNSSITITGSTASDNWGDALFAEAWDVATISVSDSELLTSINGHGIHTEPHTGSTIQALRVTIDGNRYGGIYVADNLDAGGLNTVTISESTASNNFDSGLIILNVRSTDIVVDRTTFSGNLIPPGAPTGAGIFAALLGDSSLVVSNSTVSGNSQSASGAIHIDDASEASTYFQLNSSTIVNNASTGPGSVGGVYIGTVQYAISNSILAGNTSGGVPADFELSTASAPVGTIDYSLVQAPLPSGLVAVNAGTGNLNAVDPMLGPLANNGGLTLTHLPQGGSPVINAGNPATSTPALDQRGQTRVMGTIDMGAVEIQLALAATGSDAALPLAGGAALLLASGALLVLLRRHRTAA